MTVAEPESSVTLAPSLRLSDCPEERETRAAPLAEPECPEAASRDRAQRVLKTIRCILYQGVSPVIGIALRYQRI